VIPIAIGTFVFLCACLPAGRVNGFYFYHEGAQRIALRDTKELFAKFTSAINYNNTYYET
jgi:hypothetical protein